MFKNQFGPIVPQWVANNRIMVLYGQLIIGPPGAGKSSVISVLMISNQIELIVIEITF